MQEKTLHVENWRKQEIANIFIFYLQIDFWYVKMNAERERSSVG